MYQIVEYILSGIIMVITPILFAKIILKQNIKITKIKAIIFITTISLVPIITQHFLIGMIKTISYCIFAMLLIKILYKIDYWKATILSFFYIILMMIMDVLAITTPIFIFKIDKVDFYTNYAGSLALNTIICSTLLMISYLIKNGIRKILDYKIDTSKKMVILVCLTSICMFYCFYQSFSNITLNKDFCINISIIITFLVVLISLISQLITNSKKTLEYDKLLDFMKTYEEEIENQRILRHETKNQLLTIKAKIYDKEKDNKVIKYIDSILDEKNEVSQEHYAKFQYLPANGLKALFYFKTQEAEKKGIKVSINISERIENSIIYNLKTNDFKHLGRLLGIYLDNAIEASEGSKDKNIGIEIYVISGNVKIIISNSYNHELENVSVNGKSTKGKNRGHGLLFANNIINSSKIFESKKQTTEKYYIQKLTIKKSSHITD